MKVVDQETGKELEAGARADKRPSPLNETNPRIEMVRGFFMFGKLSP
jgi:hypothetical protein